MTEGMREEQVPFGIGVDDEGMFEMANIRPERTGLPFVVFISQQGGARHDVRVKVARGPRADPSAMVSVAVRPEPRVIPPGELDAGDFRLLSDWIALNRDVLVRYWTGEIAYTEDALAALRRLDVVRGLREEQVLLDDALLDDEMFDVTNLSSRRTGLEGVIYTSTMQGRHGPRVKWYPGRPGRDAPCLVMTLEAPPRAINRGLPPREAAAAEAGLRVWVEMNRAGLLAYWKEGLGWTEEEHQAFIDGLAKLP